MVPVNAFGEHVPVIKGDPSMRESEVRKEKQPGCTLVLPQQEWWAKQFMLSNQSFYKSKTIIMENLHVYYLQLTKFIAVLSN